jgi:hypothetical protein
MALEPEPTTRPATAPLVLERLQVEEGFLDGLDLSLDPGLNVLIGPRGTGKTSIIELLRFCFAAPALTDRFSKSSREHALSVLGSGRVSVTYSVNGERRTISRTAEADSEVDGGNGAPYPIVLSQNEIEAIGLDARGRLRLVDGFRQDGAVGTRRERSVLSAVRSLSAELRELDAEIALLRSRTDELDSLRQSLAAAEREATSRQRSVAAASEELQELDRLGKDLAARSVRMSILERTQDSVRGWQEELAACVRGAPAVDAWPDGDDRLDDARGRVTQAISQVDQIRSSLDSVVAQLGQVLQAEQAASRGLEERARDLRRRVESLQEGAGAAARHLAGLREQVAALENLTTVLAERNRRADEVRARRNETLEELDGMREQRFKQRADIARWINDQLRPRIKVAVQRSGLFSDYSKAIAEVLRGSGLHYSTLAPVLAQRMAPYELARAVESDDYQTIAQIGEITEDRARRVIDRFRSVGTADILTAPLDDSVSMKLLDGDEFKDTTQLSTGQRCTVVLPILLLHGERTLIIDQPEDHLDNAFVVETLVKAIRQRGSLGQLLVSTHNPNVPVLGDARQVAVMESDGKRGFVRLSGALVDPPIVDAITSIMEGGREAFERRAKFYSAEA